MWMVWNSFDYSKWVPTKQFDWLVEMVLLSVLQQDELQVMFKTILRRKHTSFNIILVSSAKNSVEIQKTIRDNNYFENVIWLDPSSDSVGGVKNVNDYQKTEQIKIQFHHNTEMFICVKCYWKNIQNYRKPIRNIQETCAMYRQSQLISDNQTVCVINATNQLICYTAWSPHV